MKVMNTTKPYCPVSKRCGACQLLHIPYETQLTNKQREIEELFAPFMEKDTLINPIAGMDNPFHYRNKVTSPYAPGKKRGTSGSKHGQGRRSGSKGARAPREIRCGMYAGGSHHIIENDTCLIENQSAKQVVLAIRSLMQRYGIEPYDEDSGQGFIRHVVVRISHQRNEMLVTLVTNGEKFVGAKNFSRELVKRCPQITTIVQNVNTRKTNVIMGDAKEHVLYGPGFILDTLCDLSFRISSRSFYQVNADQTEVLYRRAIEMAHLTGSETVLDAYCGTGTIGLVAARGLSGEDEAHAKFVVGVDNVASAINDARNNARHNGIDNAEFFTGDAGEFMVDMSASDRSLDVVLMDPPRSGASEAFLRATCTLLPRRIVYVSCNPTTQVRDVEFLAENGYSVCEIQAVDMFPHTNHIESIVALSRRTG